MRQWLAQLAKQYPAGDDTATDRLIADAAKIDELVQSDGWRLLWDLVERAEESAHARIGNITGPVPSRAEYARLHGYLGGLREPQTAAAAFSHVRDERARTN